MSVFVRDYVDGCATCQLTKPTNNPVHFPLVPNETPTHPFAVITTDFITDLPVSEGFDSVLVVVCRHSKAAIPIPCNKNIDSDGTVDLLFQHVWRRFGLWDKMISDRGPQFAGKVMRGIYAKLGIESALSTAYHP